MLYNAPATDGGPPLVWFRSSSDGGAHWSARTSVSTDATPSFHVFPTIDAGVAGDIRIAWMDNRTGAYNVWYRSSSDRGQHWSDETKVSQFRRGYTYVPFLVPFEIARELFDYYRQGAAEVGRTVTADNLGFLICAVTAETKAKALEAGRHFVWRMGPTLRAPTEYFAPVGMRSRAGAQFALRARPRSLATLSYQELLDGQFIVAGTPDEVIDRFSRIQRELGVGHLLLEAQESRMDHPTTMRSIDLMGTKVIPAVARL